MIEKKNPNVEKLPPPKVIYTTSMIASELLRFSLFLCPEEQSASMIVKRALRLFFYKNQSRFKGEFRLKKINPKGYAFKRNDFLFLIEKILFFYKRDLLLKIKLDPQNKFEKLNWKERTVLSLSYKFDFGGNDIASLLEIPKSEFIEILYAAKISLNLSFEEEEIDGGDLVFTDSDNHYFYKKNLEIYSSLYTRERESNHALVCSLIPQYSYSMEEHFKINYFMIESLTSFAETN